MQRHDHYLPVPRERLVTALAQEFEAGEASRFTRFCRLYTALYVLRMHERLQGLKREYAPFDPDAETVPGAAAGAPEALLGQLDTLLRQANFRRLSEADVEAALTSVSPHGLQVNVELDDFAHLRLYCRGQGTQTQHRRSWQSLWFQRREVEVPVYRRLFVCVVFKPGDERIAELVAAGLSPRAARRRVRRSRGQLPPAADQGFAYLRLFKDIPQSDLETLFPNRRIRMHRWDKIRLGVTGGGGTASGVVATLTKLTAAANPLAMAAALGGLALVIARQVAKVLGQRTKYMAVLTRSLYFHCLDNNFGVIARLLDEALDEECKEALLACHCLWRVAPGTLDRAALDATVEAWVRERFALDVDFDVADGVGKLAEDGLLKEHGEALQALDLDAALASLERRWRAYTDAESEPAPEAGETGFG